MRRLVSCLIASLVVLCPVWASDAPDVPSMQNALQSIASAVVSTFAARTSIPTIDLEGVAVEQMGQDSSAPVAILSYLRCDVASLASQLESPPNRGRSFLQRMLYTASSRLSPITRIALDSVRTLQLEKGDAVLDGTLVFQGAMLDDGLFSTIFDLYIMRNWASVDFDVYISMLVSGRDYPTPLAFEGLLSVDGEDDGIVLTTEKMTCNNFLIEIAPMHMSIV